MNIDKGIKFSTAIGTTHQSLRTPKDALSTKDTKSQNATEFDHEIESFVAPVTKPIEDNQDSLGG